MDILEQILLQVKKPARYTGGEWNAVHKEWDKVDLKIAFAFPDVYEVGMSYLGLQIFYEIINRREDSLMERVFAPWPDMEEKMREYGLGLFSIESRRPVRDFDVIAFTLQYEMSYTNVLNMLDLAGIPLEAQQRDEQDPLVIAGGPCAFNPEPMAQFFDLLAIGEGEEVIGELVDTILQGRQRGLSRQELLLELAKLPGIYVPGLYQVAYKSDGSVAKVAPLRGEAPPKITKRIVKDFDKAPYPTRPLVPSTEVVHDRILLEVLRGCTRGCRFCQAGILNRPVREKEPGTVLAQAAALLASTGYDEISLTSLSTSDYTPVREVIKALHNRHGANKVGISLPSLRVDNFSVELAKEVQRVRRSSLTFAPEAGTQRLRNVINKGVTEKDLLETAGAAFREGWRGIKLYFMIGLPTETDQDLDGIADLAKKVLELGRQARVPRNKLRVTVSVSSFVPKAHTAFQWEPQDGLDELKRKQAYLAGRLKERGIVYNYHDAGQSFMEAVFARGDRRLGDVLLHALKLGCKFDGWTEYFNLERWLEAFRLAGIEPALYAGRRYGYEETLPWDHIDSGVAKDYLVEEHRRGLAGLTTADCRSGGCPGCGLCTALETGPSFAGGL
ncbi:MAG: TIGR03960 family B12-binding radical SAM protein [Pelotomaculum sp.]|jgi:radical SAM family uncharacterized protein